MSAVRVVIAGDLCPINRYEDPFVKGDVEQIFGDVLPIMAGADILVANLECPLTEHPAPIRKTGPNLSARPECVATLAGVPFHALGLANNHIMDQGVAGLQRTLQTCDRAGIQTFGAGLNLADARRILVMDAKGLRIGFLGVAEREWSLATAESPGANPFDLVDYVRNVRANASDLDCLIVLVHGGNEGYPYPSPRLLDVCRFLAEEGAGAVVCQHSHCVGCYETYQGSFIIYGQGNFVFDAPWLDRLGHEGVLVALDIVARGQIKATLIPFHQAQAGPQVRRMDGDGEARFLAELEQRSLALRDPSFVFESWQQFCAGRRRPYLHDLLGWADALRSLDKGGILSDLWCRPQSLLKMASVLQCEAHHEAVLTVLEQALERAR